MKIPEGVEVHIVGGFVRDRLLGRECNDHDFVVVGATPHQMLELGFKSVGSDFPVFLHPVTADEFALARIERKVGLGHSGFETDFNTSVTLEQDLSRRDLTINSMARRVKFFNEESHAVLEDEIFDPFGGQADLANKTIRHTTSAFAEDPLRVLRACRFASRFGFDIHKATFELMSKLVNSGELDSLSPERVWQEANKAMHEHDPRQFWKLLSVVGATRVLFPWKSGGAFFADHSLRDIDPSANTMRWAMLLSATPDVDIIRTCEALRAPSEIMRVSRKTALARKLGHKQKILTASEQLQLLKDLDALRRPGDFLNVVVPVLSLLNMRDWIHTTERCLRVSQLVLFNDLTTVEQQTLKGPAIQNRLDELKLDKITVELERLANRRTR